MIDKWTRKYMKLAKALADDNTACYSRKIGVVLISKNNDPIGFGYNGSITKSPHNDDPAYLAHIWKNILTDKQREHLVEKYDLKENKDNPSYHFFTKNRLLITQIDGMGKSFVDKFSGCETCPRKLLNIPSGESMDICNCSHAERNAIFNAAKSGASTIDAHIYCFCGTPCHECSIAIVQSGIKNVTCLKTDAPDYSKSSRGLLQMAGVNLNIIDAKDIFNE